MNTRTIVTITMISLSGVAAMLPDTKNSSVDLNAAELLEELQLGAYKVDGDKLTEILIEKDPSYMLIDLRIPEEYEKFSLPGAINIPFDSLFDDDWIAYIDQDLRNNIFYANGSTLANEALILTRQKGFKNNFALDGGLNGWFDILMDTKAPSDMEDMTVLQRHQRRLAARQYFSGGSIQQVKVKNDLLPVPTRKKTKVQGGC